MDERGAGQKKKKKVDQRVGKNGSIAGQMGIEKMSDGWTVFLLTHH